MTQGRYRSVRNALQQMIQPLGGFVLAHVAVPLKVFEQGDRKGMYARARAI